MLCLLERPIVLVYSLTTIFSVCRAMRLWEESENYLPFSQANARNVSCNFHVRTHVTPNGYSCTNVKVYHNGTHVSGTKYLV